MTGTDDGRRDQDDLVQRVREALADREPREVRMFGGISFMVDDRMVAAARSGGNLLLRIDPDDNERLLREPGAEPAYMGADREMGPGWITVRPDALAGDRLREWLTPALEFHAAQGAG